MEYIAPLIQTILWVFLIIGILWRFHKPISGILTALQKRIESGSNLKAGPFELSDQLKPQNPSKQKEKVAIEVQEALESHSSYATKSLQPPVLQNATAVQAKYFQAEDLVLRAIQTEYGATVNRQVTAGADMGFDGTFVLNGRLNIIEVKYVANLSGISRFKSTLERISHTIARYGWGNVQIILAIVFEEADDIAKANEQLAKLAQGIDLPVIVRCYSLPELQMMFDVVEHNGG